MCNAYDNLSPTSNSSATSNLSATMNFHIEDFSEQNHQNLENAAIMWCNLYRFQIWPSQNVSTRRNHNVLAVQDDLTFVLDANLIGLCPRHVCLPHLGGVWIDCTLVEHLLWWTRIPRGWKVLDREQQIAHPHFLSCGCPPRSFETAGKIQRDKF